MRNDEEFEEFRGDSGFSFHVTLVKLSDDLKLELEKAYAEGPHWSENMRMATLEDERRPTNPEAGSHLDLNIDGNYALPLGLGFFKFDGLLCYADDKEGRERLCIPRTLEEEMFKMAHNGHHHQVYHRALDRLRSSICVKDLAERLRLYIAYCPQ